MNAAKRESSPVARPALVPGFLTEEHEEIKKLGRPTPAWVMWLSRFAGNPVFLPHIIYSPFAIAAGVWGHQLANQEIVGHALKWTAGIWCLGLFSWTLVEYALHRFVFHANAESPIPTILWKWSAEIHLEHHHEPSRPNRVAAPPLLSLPYYLVLTAVYSLLSAALGLGWGIGLIAGSGLGFGFIAYEGIHAMTHLVQVKRGPFGYLKRYHLIHHFKNPNGSFGVSSPLWDIVFGTGPK